MWVLFNLFCHVLPIGAIHNETCIALTNAPNTMIATCFSVRRLIEIKFRKFRHIQDIFEFKRFVHSIDIGMNCDITNASNIKEVIVSIGDTQTMVMNWLKICKPLSFLKHVLNSARIINPRKINLT